MIHIPDSIFPKDTSGRAICPKCKKLSAECICPSLPSSKPEEKAPSPTVRLETSGRKGKVVTMIEGLPRQQARLKELAKRLKIKTGSGGTFYFGERGGTIEIQGDHVHTVRQLLMEM